MQNKSLDYETRRIRDVSLQLSKVARFEKNPYKFTTETLRLLKELNTEKNSKNDVDLSDIRAFIKGIKDTFYEVEDQINDVMKYSLRKAVVGARIKEQKLIIIG